VYVLRNQLRQPVRPDARDSTVDHGARVLGAIGHDDDPVAAGLRRPLRAHELRSGENVSPASSPPLATMLLLGSSATPLCG
jgi:hypothetical protein